MPEYQHKFTSEEINFIDQSKKRGESLHGMSIKLGIWNIQRGMEQRRKQR